MVSVFSYAYLIILIPLAALVYNLIKLHRARLSSEKLGRRAKDLPQMRNTATPPPPDDW